MNLIYKRKTRLADYVVVIVLETYIWTAHVADSESEESAIVAVSLKLTWEDERKVQAVYAIPVSEMRRHEWAELAARN